MKTKITLKLVAFCIIAYSVTLLSSCSTSSRLTSQNPHYHLELVKATTQPLPNDVAKNEIITSNIAPMPDNSPIVGCQTDNQYKLANELLKTDMKVLTKQIKRYNPEVYRQIRTVEVPKALRQLAAKSFKTGNSNSLSISNINEHGEHHYLSLWVTFLILALVFFVFTLAIPILYIFGVISFIAAVIFFILWIAALA